MAPSSRPRGSMNINALLNPQDSDKADHSVKQHPNVVPIMESMINRNSSPEPYGEANGKHYGRPPLTPTYSPPTYSPVQPPSQQHWPYHESQRPVSQYHYNENHHTTSHHHYYHPSQYTHGPGQSPAQGIPQGYNNHYYQDPFSHHQRTSLPSRPHSPDAYNQKRYSFSSTSTNGHSNGHRHSRSPGQSHSQLDNLSGSRRRDPRPKYEEEEMFYIWYHRVDMNLEWREVRECFNKQFPARQRAGFQGIQCKFYRFIKDHRCPTLREQRRLRDGEYLSRDPNAGPQSPPSPGVEYGGRSGKGPQFGVVEWVGAWYPWMRESKAEVAKKKLRRSSG